MDCLSSSEHLGHWEGGFVFPGSKYMLSELKTQQASLIWTVAAPAAAKLLQSCPTLSDPIDGSPPGSPVPGILQARTLEWVAISFSNAWKWKMKVKSLSCVWLLATPWTAAHQAPPSMGFSRQECWSGVPLPSPISMVRSDQIDDSLKSQSDCGIMYIWGDERKLTPEISMKVKVAQSCLTLATPWTIQSMEVSRPEYWSG